MTLREAFAHFDVFNTLRLAGLYGSPVYLVLAEKYEPIKEALLTDQFGFTDEDSSKGVALLCEEIARLREAILVKDEALRKVMKEVPPEEDCFVCEGKADGVPCGGCLERARITGTIETAVKDALEVTP